MDILNLMKEFRDQESCLKFIEEKRWKHGVCCIHCGSEKVGRKNKHKIVNGWNCYDCGSSFSATAGTIFHATKIPLQKWFLAISMLSTAKKSISSCQLARDLDMNQKSAWYMAMRLREKMSDNDELLKGIVEADESYVGGRPRTKSKRGRGTNKSPVIGVVERGGRVVAKFIKVLSGENIREFILSHVSPDESILMTDEFRSYTSLDEDIKRHVIHHQERYVSEDGVIHTNTIESFWACVKRAFHGTHHHYSKKWLPLYIMESCWKYNHRKDDNIFMRFFDECFT